jgi:hypothetical protein
LAELNTAGNILNTDPLFVNLLEDNFKLGDNSPAKGKGTFVNVSTDLTEKSRSVSAPTIGAYE